MSIEIINNIRVVTPNAGMWLLNAKDRVISDKVYLGINADANQWQEITTEEKERLEELWNVEENEATEEEYAMAGRILLGDEE